MVIGIDFFLENMPKRSNIMNETQKKKREVQMKKKIVIISLLLVALSISLFHLYPIIKGKMIAKSYLENLVQENYSKASSYHIDPNQKTILEQKLQSLKEKGVFIKSYKNIIVNSDDGWITGKATITLTENGIHAEYPVYIIFDGSRVNPLVTRLESLAESENLNKWLLEG
ncbi:hypothetical protein [Paenibacillus ferrarius]|nr:hypothetical protein [Paenibacillus ferrarius]